MTFLLFIIFLPFGLFAQHEDVKCVVLNIHSKEPVSNAAVIHDNNQGIICDKNGTFKLKPHYKPTDSILIKALGFYDKKISVENLFTNKEYRIYIEPRIYNLKEVVINPEEVSHKTIGIYKRKPSGSWARSNGNMIAIKLFDYRKAKHLISCLYFFVTEATNFNSKFRIHVFNSDIFGKPNQQILIDSVATSSPLKNQWVKVDLKKYNLTIPETGMFFAIEVLSDSNSNNKETTQCTPSSVTKIGLSYERNRQDLTWVYNEKKDGWTNWQDDKIKWNRIVKPNVMIKIELVNFK